MIAHRYRIAMWDADTPSNRFVECVHCGCWTTHDETAKRCHNCAGHGTQKGDDWDHPPRERTP